METKSEINIQLTERFYNTYRFEISFIMTINGHDILVDAAQEDLAGVQANLERAIPASQRLDDGWIYQYAERCNDIPFAIPANQIADVVAAISLALAIADTDKRIIEQSYMTDLEVSEAADICLLAISRTISEGRLSQPGLALSAAFDLDDMIITQLATLTKFTAQIFPILIQLIQQDTNRR